MGGRWETKLSAQATKTWQAISFILTLCILLLNNFVNVWKREEGGKIVIENQPAIFSVCPCGRHSQLQFAHTCYSARVGATTNCLNASQKYVAIKQARVGAAIWLVNAT